MEFDALTIGMLVILAVLVFFMFRNSRKRKAQAEELQTKMVPGARVMTSFGLFATLISVDDITNEAVLEVSPGVLVTVHKQTLAKAVEETPEGEPGSPRSVEEAMEIANREAAEREAAEAVETVEPAYGERVDPPKKPRSSKKAAE